MSRVGDKKKKSRSLAHHGDNTDKAHTVDRPYTKDESGEHEENHASKKLRNKKQKNNRMAVIGTVKSNKIYHETEDGLSDQNGGSSEEQGNRKRKLNKKKTKEKKKAQLDKVDFRAEVNSEQRNDDKRMETSPGTQSEIEISEELRKTDLGTSSGTRKSRKAQKKKKNSTSSNGEENLLQKRDAEEDEIYQISSGDEDCSKGMKKCITEYHQRRPGIQVLQERIDEFITAHEAWEEQERKEREALAAEDGWTVVTHHKGRKKTTDAETGVTVGSVAQAAVLDKMAKKKSKGVGLDFYRFQRREARRNEIMMLQDKFEQDKKKIQQLREARKFRPY
ncbi:hypothetical protein ACH5RR_038739 [Cinchona calisaya]|uniref:Ribosomal RNA-processing protein 7 C-terminal domain-containing protein n=1 Tax=Cinchona calisaya TaxID=153742 RepID=A0ABD2XYP5_9GENT